MRRKFRGLTLLAFTIGGLVFLQAPGQDSKNRVIPDSGVAYGGTFTQATQAVRKMQGGGAAPPASDERLKKLGERLDQLAKDLTALKSLDKRLADAEKGVKELAGLKGLEKRLETAEKGLKDLAGLQKKLDDIDKQLKALDKLKDVPGQLDKLDKAIKGLSGSLQKLEEAVKKLDSLPGQVKAVESKVAKLEEAVKRIDALAAQIKAAEGKILKLEEAAKKIDAQAAQIKVLSERLDRDAARSKATEEKLKQLEDRIAKEKAEREKTAKSARRRRKKESDIETITLPPGFFPPCPPPVHCCPPVSRGCPSGFVPATGYGCFGECFPVITPCWGWGPGAVETELPTPKMDRAKDGKKEESAFVPGEIPTSIPVQAVPVSLQTAAPAKASPAKAEKIAAPRVISVKKSLPLIDRRGLTEADAERLFWRGHRLYLQAKYDEALALFNVAVELSAEDARFWYFKSLSETAREDTSDAARSLARAVDLHLDGKPGAEEIGRALERVQGEARRKLREALDAQRTRK